MYQLKVINASQGCIHKYENLKRKLYNCNANIYFNQQRIQKQWNPNYVTIKDPNTSPAFKYTQQKVPNIRIKDEIKYLYTKKQHLNQQIYHLHLILVNSWNNIWPYIQHTIEKKLKKKAIQFKYKNLDKEQTKLIQEQIKTPREIHSFYPKIINNSNITSPPQKNCLTRERTDLCLNILCLYFVILYNTEGTSHLKAMDTDCIKFW